METHAILKAEYELLAQCDGFKSKFDDFAHTQGVRVPRKFCSSQINTRPDVQNSSILLQFQKCNIWYTQTITHVKQFYTSPSFLPCNAPSSMWKARWKGSQIHRERWARTSTWRYHYGNSFLCALFIAVFKRPYSLLRSSRWSYSLNSFEVYPCLLLQELRIQMVLCV